MDTTSQNSLCYTEASDYLYKDTLVTWLLVLRVFLKWISRIAINFKKMESNVVKTRVRGWLSKHYHFLSEWNFYIAQSVYFKKLEFD